MKCLHTLFSEQAQQTPNAPAVVDDHAAISYAELDRKSDELARYFVSQGLQLDDTVGLYMAKSVDYVVGCLAALKAGGAFLPLFLDYPESLLGKVLEQTQTKFVLTTSQLSSQLSAPDSQVLEMDNLGEFKEDSRPLPQVSVDNLMFVVYTSGTTGEPKGIQLPHRAAVHSYEQRRTISNYKPGQRVACNIFFVWEIFRPLIKGAAIHVISDDIIYDPKLLSEFLHKRKITEVLFTPSLMETMLNHLPAGVWNDKLSSLEVIWLNGEVVTEKLKSKALEVLPSEVGFFNTYSISECHDVASLDLRQAEPSGTPFCRVGYPIDGITVFCMDENGQPLADEEGELYVGGPGLARGYLGKPHLTAERFVLFQGQRLYRTGDIAFQYPDGLLEIRGRCDSMVKIRGYSVHLGAVQSCLEKLESVKSAAVVAVGEEGRDKRLVAYVVGHPERSWTIDPCTGSSPEIREQLRQHLAEFMLPNHFIELDNLPLSPTTGKLDTKLLPPPPERQVFETSDLILSEAADYTEKQHLVSKLWERLLGLDPGVVDAESNFFDLGGHSLMAVRCTQHIERIMGFPLSVKQLYTYPTVKQLTQFLHTGKAQVEPSAQGPQPEDWKLPESVQPTESSDPSSVSQAKAIFLTGATGFLGGFTLDTLVRHSSCPIYCLVRPGKVSAQARLEQNLKSYGLESSGRIRAIAGDLSKENFGLKADDYDLLCRDVDLVFHCGAAVNYVHNYAVLKPHTVGGTLEVLKLCCHGKAKTLHYISTNGVFPGGGTYLENSEIEGYLKDLGNGYGHSKWVAEMLVWQAVERGLQATLYRPGNIGHHRQSGAANANDFQYLLVRACQAIKAVPKVEDWYFEMTPVDFLVETMLAIAESRSYSGQVFNIVQRPTTPAHDFLRRLQELDSTLVALTVADWTQALREYAQSTDDSKLEVLANSLPDVEGYLKDTSCYDSRELQAALKELRLTLPEAGIDYLLKLAKAQLEVSGR